MHTSNISRHGNLYKQSTYRDACNTHTHKHTDTHKRLTAGAIYRYWNARKLV